MRTIAYVDGYNLYHGRLKYTQFKWLDLQGLLSSILRIQNPSSDLTAVKLFTASIKAKQILLCTNDSDLAPAVEFIRSDCPKIIVGIVLPRPPELKARRWHMADLPSPDTVRKNLADISIYPAGRTLDPHS
jgi:hypothetical protein